MRRVLTFVFGFIISFSLLSAVKADDNVECKYGYGNDELKIIYNPNLSFDLKSSFTNPHIVYSGFDSNTKPKNIYFLKIGRQIKGIDGLEIDQNLFKNVKNTCACPSDMVVCTYFNASARMLLPTTLTNDILDSIITSLFDGDSSTSNSIIDSTVTLNIMDDETYKNSDYWYYKDGRVCIGSSCKIGMGLEKSETGWEKAWTVIKGIGQFANSLTGIGDNTIFAFQRAYCDVVKYTGPCTAVNINCPDLAQLILKEQEYISNYKACDGNNSCKNGLKKNINSTEDTIKSKCRRILSKYKYSGGQSGCIDACLSIKDTLDDLKKGTDLYKKDIGSGECGVSQRILNWINNIIKWVKYIVPVLVIVLGILDFMKAIGADKDDEFKKAQGKFVKRLIAAALIFIVPLILGFILEKMGFGFNSCGLF